jgi:hypothetical protein
LKICLSTCLAAAAAAAAVQVLTLKSDTKYWPSCLSSGVLTPVLLLLLLLHRCSH